MIIIMLIIIKKTDIYVFLISDGDNLSTDNDRCKNLLPVLEQKVKVIDYLEINLYYDKRSSLYDTLFSSKKFLKYKYKKDDDMYNFIRSFFRLLPN